MKVFAEYEATQRGAEKATKYVPMVETALLPFTDIKSISMDVIIRHLQEDGLRKASTIKAYCHALQHFDRCIKVRECTILFSLYFRCSRLFPSNDLSSIYFRSHLWWGNHCQVLWEWPSPDDHSVQSSRSPSEGRGDRGPQLYHATDMYSLMEQDQVHFETWPFKRWSGAGPTVIECP